jgi:catechol 2,3-dioxygenase-like lactoylglutathione lyase family enzyme
MINGAHAIIYSTDADADRSFFQDVLQLPAVDAGGGWLIFGLPPAEVAVHPSDGNGTHELYLMCDDIEAFVAAVDARGMACAPVRDQGWGLLTQLTLSGGGRLGVYQPRHPRPPIAGGPPPKAARRKAKPTKRTPKVTRNATKKRAPAATGRGKATKKPRGGSRR